MNEYGRWPETTWASDNKQLAEAETIKAGFDIGTTSTQAVLLAGDELLAYSSIRTGADFDLAYKTAMQNVINAAGISADRISSQAACGFGKQHAAEAEKIDEIQCHAKGARFIFGPSVETVIDLGGQTTKAIRLFEWDRVRDFMISDKCASGMGRNIESLCGLLQIHISEIGALSLEVEKDPEPVSTTCFPFAQTETMGLFHPGFKEAPLSENEIYASHMFAVAWRALGVIGKLRPLDVGEIDTYGEYAFTGGLAKNPGITKRIERELRKPALTSDIDPMIAGAVGAALLA